MCSLMYSATGWDSNMADNPFNTKLLNEFADYLEALPPRRIWQSRGHSYHNNRVCVFCHYAIHKDIRNQRGIHDFNEGWLDAMNQFVADDQPGINENLIAAALHVCGSYVRPIDTSRWPHKPHLVIRRLGRMTHEQLKEIKLRLQGSRHLSTGDLIAVRRIMREEGTW